MAKPQPALDVPVLTPSGLMNQAWFEYFQGLQAFVGYLDGKAIPHDDTKSNVVRTPNNQAGTSYTFVLTDSGKVCTFQNAAAQTVTVPPNSSVAFDVGTQIDLIQAGSGKVTFAQGSGVSIVSLSSNKSLSGLGAAGTLYKFATNTWILTGSLIP